MLTIHILSVSVELHSFPLFVSGLSWLGKDSSSPVQIPLEIVHLCGMIYLSFFFCTQKDMVEIIWENELADNWSSSFFISLTKFVDICEFYSEVYVRCSAGKTRWTFSVFSLNSSWIPLKNIFHGSVFRSKIWSASSSLFSVCF